MRNILKYILIISIGAKPLIDLTWAYNIIGGLNFQGASLIIIAMLLLVTLKEYKINKVFIPLLVFMVLLIINSIVQPEMISANLKFIMSFFYLPAIVFYLTSVEDYKKTFWILFCSMLLISFISYLQAMGKYPYYYFTASIIQGQRIGRASGGFGHPNDYMRFFVPLIIFFLILRNHKCLSKKHLRYAYTGFLFMLPAAFLTFHRMSYLIIILSVLIDLIYRNKFKWIGAFVLFLLFIIVKYADQLYFSILATRLRIEDGISGLFHGGRLSAFYDRVQGYLSADFHDKIFGSGLFDGFEHGDNDFGRVLYSVGIIALISLVWYHVLYWIRLYRFKNKYDTYSLVLCGFMFFAFSLTTDPTRYPSFLLLYFILVSAGLKNLFKMLDIPQKAGRQVKLQ